MTVLGYISRVGKIAAAAAAGFVALAPVARAQQASASEATPATDLKTIVQKMTEAQQEVREQYRSYELTRRYEIFDKDKVKPSTEVTARIDYLPPDQKKYAIEKSTGGMGERAIRHALDHEMDLTKSPEKIEMTERNYTFSLLGETQMNGHKCWLLESHPKRDEKDLLNAKVWVDEDSYRVMRIAGHPQKSPSFWVKDIDLTLEYGEMGGMWMHTATRAVADVRFTGAYTVVSHDVNIRSTPMVAKARPRHGARNAAALAAVIP